MFPPSPLASLIFLVYVRVCALTRLLPKHVLLPGAGWLATLIAPTMYLTTAFLVFFGFCRPPMTRVPVKKNKKDKKLKSDKKDKSDKKEKKEKEKGEKAKDKVDKPKKREKSEKRDKKEKQDKAERRTDKNTEKREKKTKAESS